nr:MAG TPA: hypothetical protein [Caudoviricetes sp.]
MLCLIYPPYHFGLSYKTFCKILLSSLNLLFFNLYFKYSIYFVYCQA